MGGGINVDHAFPSNTSAIQFKASVSVFSLFLTKLRVWYILCFVFTYLHYFNFCIYSIFSFTVMKGTLFIVIL